MLNFAKKCYFSIFGAFFWTPKVTIFNEKSYSMNPSILDYLLVPEEHVYTAELFGVTQLPEDIVKSIIYVARRSCNTALHP